MCAYVLCTHMGGFLNGLPPYFLRRVSHWPWGSMIQLDWWVSEFQGVTYLCLPSQELQACRGYTIQRLPWVLRIWIQVFMTSMSETDLASKYLINTHHNYVHWADVVGLDGMWGHTM